MSRRLFLLLFGVLSHSICAAQQLVVSAAASLKLPLEEIVPAFQTRNPACRITQNFGGSTALQRQIGSGAPADLVIFAAPQPMDVLEHEKLIFPETRRVLLTNKLVLIAPTSDSTLTDSTGLTSGGTRHVAIGEPKTAPAGAYAIEYLAKVNLLAAVEQKLVRLLDVRQVLTAVETGNADAGFVYRTDAISSKNVRIVLEIPPDTHSPIVYPAAVVATSKQRVLAQEYLEFLQSADAVKIFSRHGFGIPK